MSLLHGATRHCKERAVLLYQPRIQWRHEAALIVDGEVCQTVYRGLIVRAIPVVVQSLIIAESPALGHLL